MTNVDIDYSWIDYEAMGLNPNGSPKKFEGRSFWEKIKSAGKNLAKWTYEALAPTDAIRAVKGEEFSWSWLALDILSLVPWAKWVKLAQKAIKVKLTKTARKKITDKINDIKAKQWNVQSHMDGVWKSEKMWYKQKDSMVKRDVEDIQWMDDANKKLLKERRMKGKEISGKVNRATAWVAWVWAAAWVASMDEDPNGLDIDYPSIDEMNETMERNNEEMSNRLREFQDNQEVPETSEVPEVPEVSEVPEVPERKTFISWLDEQWIDSSKEHRASIAEALWIENYDYSKEKNMELWKRLKEADPLEFKNTEVSEETKREAQAKQGLF